AAAMQRIADAYVARPLHCCFANAGVGAPGSVLASSDETWQWAWDVNVAAVLRTLRLWWPHLVAGAGKAVATVSAAALQSYPGADPYRATKAALLSALEGLFYEAQGCGVSVHALCPGLVRTDIIALGRYEEASRLPPMGPNPFADFIREAMKHAEPADHFAVRVLDELDAGAPFYWFTHRETMDWIDKRHKCVVRRTRPFTDFGSAA
ncbi:partial Oxidoreductase UcpA, partial [Burkholderiaceae bacterium]